MQNPNEDTEWNDILRQKGILPPKEIEVTEEQLVEMAEDLIKSRSGEKALEDRTLDELDELEDEMLDDERVLLEYRMKRMAELRMQEAKNIFGEVREISQTEFVKEVSEASKNVWVIAFLYKPGIIACKLMANQLNIIAKKYPDLKIVSIIGDKCIPNYPDRNLPTLLVYGKGDLVRQQVGLVGLGGMSMTVQDLEMFLDSCGAIKARIAPKDDEDRTNIIRGMQQNSYRDEDSD